MVNNRNFRLHIVRDFAYRAIRVFPLFYDRVTERISYMKNATFEEISYAEQSPNEYSFVLLDEGAQELMDALWTANKLHISSLEWIVRELLTKGHKDTIDGPKRV